ncbi:hypothetical protein KXS07_19850 [Inquilinus limosus]|uniref:hypothetical protein n=1 Tax=Inquilinus limosus TaxID=171674 RepID=UPI003F147F75
MTHRPDRALERLLDALEAELAAAPDDEIRQAAAEAGPGIAVTAGVVRDMIRRAGVEAASSAAPGVPVPQHLLPPPRWH